jgi:hypothetical protein
MATLTSGRNLILNQNRIYTLSDKISEQPISFFDTDIVKSKSGSSRQIHPGRHYDFLGTNEYVEVPDHADFSFGDGSNDSPFSVGGWINMDDAQLCKMIVKYDVTGNPEWMFGTGSGSTWLFELQDDSASAAIGRYYNTSLATRTGEWLHFIGTYDGLGVEDGIKIYLNGIRVDNLTGSYNSYTAMEPGSDPVHIGQLSFTYSDCKMHDVRIHSKELSKEEVWDIYHHHSASGHEVGWWKMEEGGGDISLDSSGRGHHGEVKNATLSTFHVSSSAVSKSFLNDNGYSGGRYFPGSYDVNLATTSDNDLDPGTGDYTVDCWFYNAGTGVNRAVLSKGGGSPTVEGYYFYINTSDQIVTRHSDGIAQHQITSTALADGWNYVAMVVDRDYAVYQHLNGEGVKTLLQSESEDVQPTQIFSIGSYDGGSTYHDSLVGTVRYTARVLTPEEIRDTHNNGFTAFDETKLIAQPDDYGNYIDVVGDRHFRHETTTPVYIPRNESNTSLDVSGQQLMYPNQVKYNTAVSSMCADFDGTAAYVNISDDDLLTFGDGSADEPFSISAWINMDDATNFFIFGKLGAGGNFESGFYVNGSDKLYLQLYDYSELAQITRIGPVLTDYQGKWIYVAATYDGLSIDTGIKLYLNGVRVDDSDDSSGSYTAMEGSTAENLIGRYSTSYADGSICDVRVYDKELTQVEIIDVMNTGNQNGSEVAWYPLAEGNGEIVHDVSGNGLHGIVTGATLSNFWGQTQTVFHYNNRMGFSDGLYFDGTTSDGVIAAADATDFNPGTSDFTVEAYIFGGTLNDYIIEKRGGSGNGWEFYITAAAKMHFLIDDTTATFNLTADTSIGTNQIHYVAVTVDRDGNATHYLDGIKDGSSDVSGSDGSVSNSDNLGVGSIGGTSNFFDGSIYAIKYSNVARSADEIFFSYSNGLINDSNTVALWDFKNGEGINVADENSNNITLSNTAQIRAPALSTNLRKDVFNHPIQHTGGGLNGSGDVVDFTGGTAAPRWNDFRLGYVDLNGTDDYIDCGDHVELSFIDTDGDLPFSISAWIFMNDATSFPIVTKTASLAEEWYFIVNSGDALVLHLFDESANARIQQRSSAITKYEGEWIYVAATYDGAADSSGIKIYVNGSLQSVTPSDTGTYLGMENQTTVVSIGKLELNSTFADGYIRDVKIYGEELSAAQVSEDYKTGAVFGGALLRDFKLHKDAYDSSTHKQHGEILGTNINFPLATVDTSYERGNFVVPPFYKKCSSNPIIEAVNATDRVIIPSKAAYGIWEFDFYKGADGNTMFVNFILSVENSSYTDGYYLRFNITEYIGLVKITGGSSSGISTTSTSYFNNNQWYNFKIVRNSITNEYVGGAVGTFAMYLDGSLITVTSGTNPVTDNTHTTSNLITVSIDDDDKIKNFKHNDVYVNLSKIYSETATYIIDADKENNFVLLERPLIATASSRPLFRYTKTGESS